MSKHDPLRDMLLQIPPNVSEKTLTFGEIESILGFKLPESAYNHRPWWANPSSANDHPYAQAWLAAGWKVETVNQSQKWVRLLRVAGSKRYSKTPDKTPDRIPTDPLPQITRRSIKIVISCAGRKFENAGRLTTSAGEEVLFVAHPERCIQQANCYRPDDNMEGTEGTW